MKLTWKILFWINLSIIFIFWLKGSGSFLTLGPPFVLVALGRLMGLLGSYAILIQFLLAGRSAWLEKTFGLDRLLKIHHVSGKWGILLILTHPILLTLGYAATLNNTVLGQLQIFIFNYENVLNAVIGLFLFIIVVAMSLYISRRHLRYETWYYVHLIVYLAVFLAFGHQIKVGADLLASQLFFGYWLVLYTAVLLAHLFFRFYKPLYLYFRHQFTIEKVVRENHNTVSLYISGRQMSAFQIAPGQFIIVRFLVKRLWWQAHPFSLSMAPDGQRLRITIKELGDFTGAVQTIKSGVKVIIDGPYGIFTAQTVNTRKVLFIAGGIGITPIRSLIEQMSNQSLDIDLLYGAKTSEDLVFKQELDSLAADRGVSVNYILSGQPGYQGLTGRLDTEKIKSLVPDWEQRDWYICGPEAMMQSLIISFKNLGLPAGQLHYERFVF